jgi:hypothetical protein
MLAASPRPAVTDFKATLTTVASSWEASLREAAVSPGDCQRLSLASLYTGLELDPAVSD